MLSKEELNEIGVNVDNLQFNGEMNVIVQCLISDEDDDDYESRKYQMMPDIYHPRKNSVYSCGCRGEKFDLTDSDTKAEYLRQLRDSAERHKIMAYYLTKQADEIEKLGYPVTNFYYPE